MTDLPKFKNPSNREEHLISELIKELNHTYYNFLRKTYGKSKINNMECFLVTRDAVINFSGGIISSVIQLLIPEQKNLFIKECQEIFIQSINQI